MIRLILVKVTFGILFWHYEQFRIYPPPYVRLGYVIMIVIKSVVGHPLLDIDLPQDLQMPGLEAACIHRETLTVSE